jgi:hypothetical protein
VLWFGCTVLDDLYICSLPADKGNIMEQIEYLETVVPNAYHGTSKSNAENIVNTGKFCVKPDPDLFLGDGVYFYDGSKELAERWATRKFSGQPIGIIIGRIRLGYCLNLLIPEHRNLVKQTAKEIRQKRFSQRVTDALVLNYFTRIIEPKIDTVKSHFGGFKKETVSKIFDGSNIVDSVYIVICVKKPECIVKFSMAQ